MSLTPNYPTASLKPHRDEPLRNGHLWVFSGALQQPPRWVEAGGLLDIKSATGQFVARGYYNAQTDIAIRVLTFDQDEPIDAAFLRRRIRRALELRHVFDPAQTNVYRLIHSEGDGLPGLVVDRFADVLVAQVHTAGMERLLPLMGEILLEETGAQGLLVRNEGQSRRREGLLIEEPRLVAGTVPEQVIVRENGVQFAVDPWHGQKTGFFIDQRDKRAALRHYARLPATRVLNCFSYTGGFSINAALADESIHTTSVDISAPALALAQQNFRLNALDPDRHEFVEADVFDYLEEVQSQGQLFDLVVLDPPAFAKTQSVRSQALKAYRRLNTLGISVLRPGGVLLTCSCSGVVGMDDLLGVLALASRQHSRAIQLLDVYTHAVDHPINLAMPETAYLKAIYCRVL